MDGWSRFQNYKRAKDQFYMHGFNQRIADTYIGSQCQRMAAIVAAEELGIGDELKEYYIEKMSNGIIWFRTSWSRTRFSFLKRNFGPAHSWKKTTSQRFDYRNLQSQFELQP